MEYKTPKSPPSYDYVYNKHPSKNKIYNLIDRFFAGYGLVLIFCYAFLLCYRGLHFNWKSIIILIGFWFILTYLALPRLHRTLTLAYIPDYFMARTKTGDGLLGDPINLAIIGSAEDICAAMQNAGWSKADPITLKSSLGIIFSSLTGKSYKQAPVSNLYLFDQVQDFAYQQEVNGSATKRHHVRFWKVPEHWRLVGGKKVNYLAAATFDRAVGLSSMTWQITHKIDGDIDKERDYLIETLLYTDPKLSVEIIPWFSTPFHDRNGGGDKVYTDGNMPILNMANAKDRNLIDLDQTPHNDLEKYIEKLNNENVNKVLEKRLPPKSLIYVGIALALEWLFSFFVFLTNILHLFSQNNLVINKTETITFFISSLLLASSIHMILFYLTLKRKKWARLWLMIATSFAATSSLIAVSLTDNSFTNLIFSGLTVSVALALSSPSLRQYVHPLKTRSS